ncbi:hypothetical protein GCM10010260_83830 [Streptomyces filipinensis]|uniref:Uncharacterized protein n=1 Tax=Streptomyces filipinensis TaxID=66887 RepID=A0A918IK86_9ACTN|nr:hypothetical protein [Streptomyces filipinensis]GGV30538.1 hypothetical protein GCM10010260_83830 [Streptomyces filipinensis]
MRRKPSDSSSTAPSGTQKTYAYHLVDHLRWRVRERLHAQWARNSGDLENYFEAADGWEETAMIGVL